MKEKLIGIDLGGTKINGALLKSDGEIVTKVRLQTGNTEKGEEIVEKMLSIINQLKESNSVKAIGIGSAGFIDNKKGIVKASPNIKFFKNFNLAETIKLSTNIETFVDNDVKAGAVAELLIGEGKDVNDFVFITLGTGIGGAIVINKHLVRGADNLAGEIGHITFDENGYLCGCGKRGCLETIASGPAIKRAMLEAMKNGRKTMVLDLVQNDISEIDVPNISEAALLGDKLSIEVLSKAAHYIGLELSYLTNTLNPEKIIIAGGLINGLEPVKKVIYDSFDKFTLEIPKHRVKIIVSTLGMDSVSIGAGLYALKRINKEEV
jgi:glucokinase